MMRQISLLLKINLFSRFGFNEARYSKDKKKKNRLYLLGFTFVILGLMLAFYVSTMSYSFVILGIADILPAYVLAITSVIILFFSIFKAGSEIFQMKTYEMLISLPLKPVSIVISRFLNMYITNLICSALVVLPATIVYGIFEKPELGFYILMVLGVFLLPLIPMTIATAIGALITAISSRMKHKNLVSVVLSMILVIGVLVASFASSSLEGKISESIITDYATMLSNQINRMYPPASIFTDGVINGNILSYLLFAVISIGVFVIFVLIVQWKFVSICSALNSSAAKNNYVIKEMQTTSPLVALYKKELKRYFSSSVYVMNTAVGYVMLVVFAVAILVMGVDEVEEMLEMKGVIAKIVPLIVAMLCSFTTTTVSSISIEGKEWWILQSLPVSSKNVFLGKIMVNITMGLPAIIISDILICIRMDMSLLGYVWMIIVPILYLLFTSVLGILINAKMPMMNWEAEVTVIKQSGAVLIGMLIGFAVSCIPIVAIVLTSFVYTDIIMAVVSFLILLVLIISYQILCKIKLIQIQ